MFPEPFTLARNTRVYIGQESWITVPRPRGARGQFFILSGPGGAGGNGRTAASGNRGGGGGGASGAISTLWLPTTEFTPKALVAQLGGISSTTTSILALLVGEATSGASLLYANAGGAGGNGGASAGAAGSAPGVMTTQAQFEFQGVMAFNPGQAGVLGGAATGAVGVDLTFGAAGVFTSGGAGGAGTSAADFTGGGIVAGGPLVESLVGGAAGTFSGQRGFDFRYMVPMFSTGGSGGGSSNLGTGGNGGDGGPGSGGGGGGGGVTGGTGGKGGPAFLIHHWW